jgi:hypothetical protein
MDLVAWNRYLFSGAFWPFVLVLLRLGNWLGKLQRLGFGGGVHIWK